MRIILVHNFYQQPGGEDVIFFNEKALLKKYGHDVREFTRHNNKIKNYNLIQKLNLFFNTYYNFRIKREFYKFVKKVLPDVLHFHNTFPLISPSVYSVGRELNIPVVQTVHNYRFLCANGIFYRDNKICEDCLGKSIPWPGLLHACYHYSRLQTLPVSLMQSLHNICKTWQSKIDTLVALTEFGKEKMVQAGFSKEKILVKPNFIYPDPGYFLERGDFFIFVGRLSEEKGLRILLRACESLANIPLKIVGDGPLYKDLKHYNLKYSSTKIEFLGRLPQVEVLSLLCHAASLLFTSECYEGLPTAIIEAFACGTPVIASRLGAMAEIVEDGRTGLLFSPGDAEDLAAKVQWAWDHPREMKEMGKNARQEYEAKYTAERNYQMLMDIYHKAIENKKK